MNRRFFLRTLGLFAGALAAPLPVLTPEPVVKGLGYKTWIVNPEWVDAPYELSCPALIEHAIDRELKRFAMPPLRYRMGKDGLYHIIPPYVEVSHG